MKKTHHLSRCCRARSCSALAGTALAQSSVDGYNEPGRPNPEPGRRWRLGRLAVAVGGSLPFTGLDVALLAGAGGLLVAAGFGMRRLTRAPGRACLGRCGTKAAARPADIQEDATWHNAASSMPAAPDPVPT